jgi:hypothetical protein
MTQIIATNRNEIAENAKKTLQDLALFVFGYGGIILSIAMCVFMWRAISSQNIDVRGTFQVFGTFKHEAQIVMGGTSTWCSFTACVTTLPSKWPMSASF